MNAPCPEPGLWPLEVVRLHGAIHAARAPAERDAARGALWRLLFEALTRYLRVHSRHTRGTSPADLEDIASEKALEILARAESGAWDLCGRSAAEISGYLSRVARNGWVDLVQRASREVRVPEGGEPDRSLEGVPDRPGTLETSPGDRVEGVELALALRDCAESLPERERRIWFFRAFYEMSSREIAAHPLIRLNAAHVDVVAQRARLALRECLGRKGHTAGDAPPGAFIELWSQLEEMAAGDLGELLSPGPGSGSTGRMG